MTEIRTPLRRRPAQRRSAERVQRMLDACADILDEDGYDGLTTTRIAQRAEVAIGSVYQFFPDKRAVAQALALRNLEQFGQRISRRLAEGGFAHWTDTVGAIIDIFVDMHRTVPGFRELRFGDVADINLLDSVSDNNSVVADRLRRMIVENFAISDTAELARALAIAVEAGDAVLKLAFRRAPGGDPAIIAEAERLIHGYLAAYIKDNEPMSGRTRPDPA
ncbi:TetR/AcrR family transcriptional regulator [Actinomadura rugatobispora]|uniref:TetR/AcrR family transcriptional regulator n=1 Tax=Actinomadura rugatobispora TaxID=1994 RepID=A0ABW1A3H3_9ACTN|nr:TetR family transcriptional regulator [Actinomadura rugatobispora]